jgi:hypothetical protein
LREYTAFGYYPTIGDRVLIARLYQGEGELGEVIDVESIKYQ